MSHSLKTHLKEIIYLKSLSSLLHWDQETQMPAHASLFRSEQSAFVEGLFQEKILDSKIRHFIDTETHDPTTMRHQALLKEEVAKKSIPKELVEEIAKHTVLSIESWRKAREKNDFSLFRDDLKKMIELQQQVADLVKKGGTRYDALVSFFDPDLTYAQIQTLFDPLEQQLKKVILSKSFPKKRAHRLPAPIAEQKKVCEELVQLIAPNALLAETTHPFCTDIGPVDIRISTRYNPEDLFEAIYSTLHELGHALYEQQLPHSEPYPLNQALSLTVHESQSKLFETCIGGSTEFLTYLYGRICHHLKHCPLTLEEFLESRFAIFPQPIRIESDEFTYPLHIIFRTKIEQALIEGTLSVDDLPQTFRHYQKELLDLDITTEKEGCLQDIHWACGNFGYFPTYLTGCMYAHDQYAAMSQTFNIKKALLSGDIELIRHWLKEAIHHHGSRYPFRELLEKSTKHSLNAERYFHYLQGRFL